MQTTALPPTRHRLAVAATHLVAHPGIFAGYPCWLVAAVVYHEQSNKPLKLSMGTDSQARNLAQARVAARIALAGVGQGPDRLWYAPDPVTLLVARRLHPAELELMEDLIQRPDHCASHGHAWWEEPTDTDRKDNSHETATAPALAGKADV